MSSGNSTSAPVGSAPTRPPQSIWPTAGHVIAAGVVLALVALVLALAFLQFERQEKRSETRAELLRLAKAMDNQTASSLGAVEAMLRVVSNADHGLLDVAAAGRMDPVFAGVVRGFPQLRSVSVLNPDGLVVASTNAENLGAVIDIAALGMKAVETSRVSLGPVLQGRDLADLRRLDADSPALRVLPMLVPLNPGPGREMLMVALLNADYFGLRFEATASDPNVHVALADFQGNLLVASSNVRRASGSTLAHLPVFAEFLPQREWGSYIGAGIDDTHAIAAFSTLRQWPFVMLVDMSQRDALKEVALLEQWVLTLLAATWLAIATVTYASSRSLRRHSAISRQLNHEVYASEARNNAVLESSMEGVITIDGDGTIVAFNQAAERIFGRARQDCIGKPMEDLLVPHSLKAAHSEGMKKYVQSGDGPTLARLNRRIETDGRHADGSLFPIELSIVSVRVDEALFFTANVRDISEQKRAAQERADLLRKYHVAVTYLEQQNAELLKAESALKEARARELEVGNRIQQALLSASPEQQLPGLWFSNFNQASKGIDGDFVDVIKLGERCVDFIVGDVMGKGVPAALLGAATKLQFSRSLAELLARAGRDGEVPQPAAIVSSVHRAMTTHLLALDSFVTLAYMRIDLERGLITWVGCGHEESLLIRANGEARSLANQHPPMGILDHCECTQSQVALADDDVVFMCSDGLADAISSNGDRLGRDFVNASLCRILREHRSPAVALHVLRRDLLGSTVQLTDDVTMVFIMQPPKVSAQARCELPLDLKSLHALRQFVLQQAMQAGVSEADAALLEVASVEVFTNIVRHGTGLLAGAPVELVVRHGADEFVLDIIHIGDAFIPPEEQAETDFSVFPEGGFGLIIIRNACDRVEYLHKQGVNTVRMSRHLVR